MKCFSSREARFGIHRDQQIHIDPELGLELVAPSLIGANAGGRRSFDPGRPRNLGKQMLHILPNHPGGREDLEVLGFNGGAREPTES